MEISIKKAELSSVAESISCYIFKEVRSGTMHDIEWLTNMCKFYQGLLNVCVEDRPEDYISFTVTDKFASDLENLIVSFLYEEVLEYADDDVDRLCEMVNLREQLKGSKPLVKNVSQISKNSINKTTPTKQSQNITPAKGNTSGKKSKQATLTQQSNQNDDMLFFDDEDSDDSFI